MKKTIKLLALVLALALVFSLTACAKQATITGSWKYSVDFMKLFNLEAEETTEETTEETQDPEEAAAMEAMLSAMKKMYDGLSMDIILDLKEDNTFTMTTDEDALKTTGEKLKERAKEYAPELLKAMFGEEMLNAMLEEEGKTMEEYANEYADQMDVSDMEIDTVSGTYSYEEGKLVLSVEGEKPVTLTVELSAKELKVTAIESEEIDEEDLETYKALLPLVFVK